MTYADRATDYAQKITRGEIPACLLVRLACQRHLDWLADEDSPYRWDKEAADKVCGFVEELPHTKGKWALNDELIKLEDWQCFVVAVPFGWLRKSDGFRVFRRTYIEVPRKNAKSTLTAGLGDYMLTSDGEMGAEVYSGAGTEKQAWEVFGPARLMAKNSQEMLDAFGLEVNAKNMNVLSTNSKFEPIIGKPGDGASPSFSITDEYHEHKTSEQYDTMVTGMGSREQPMAWVITTAGDDTSGPCYNLRGKVVAMLNNQIGDDTLFGIIFTIDEDTDWTSKEALKMANPNMGVSVFEEFLVEQQKNAINNPRDQSTFKKKHLDIWVTAASPFFNLEKWNRLADPSLSIDDFKEERCWVGVDLASKLDVCATVKIFCRELEGKDGEMEEHFYVFPWFYIPDQRIEEPEYAHYRQWREQEWVTATEGNVTNYDYIEDDLIADAAFHRFVELGFDPWGGTQFITHLMEAGIECVEIPQNVRNLSEPMKWIQALIDDGRIHHEGNPILGWMIGNVTAKTDHNENVFPRKEHDHTKIDGVSALLNAKSRWLEYEDETSVYETRGPIIV